MKKQVFIVLSALVVLMLACNLSQNGTVSPTQNESQPATTQQNGKTQPTETQPPTKPNQPHASPTPTISSQPVSIKAGLASLNSYKMTIVMITSSSPDPKSSTTINMEVQHSQDQDATYTHATITTATKDEKPSVTENNIYAIGNDQCSGSKEDWTWQSLPANQKEMQDLMSDMLSITPIIENPQFVGQETVNNISSNHFKFKVSGLGVKSGAEVTANQGDYWLAIDGQYIVKYILVAETKGGSNSEVIHLETHVELTDINQPVTVSFPAQCIAAKNATPTP